MKSDMGDSTLITKTLLMLYIDSKYLPKVVQSMKASIEKSRYNISPKERSSCRDKGLTGFEKDTLDNTLRRHKESFRELGQH